MYTEIKKRRGIQLGQNVTDEQAKTNDNLLKIIAKDLEKELNIPGLSFQIKLNKDQIKSKVGACQPDGGIWFYNEKPICFFESKKQNNGGNAIERWYKNHWVLSRINPNILSGTFCVGGGAKKGGVIWKTLHEACEGNFDCLQNGNSVFLSEQGFNHSFVKDKIKEIILMSIGYNK
jgi:hypothetical protein